MTRLTAHLKQMLWQRHGQPDFPAEWDGHVYGGGRISQRFWEYQKTIEMLELDENSIVLDIGGGSPATGISFFPRLLADAGLRVFVLDVHFGDNVPVPENVTLIRGLADEATLYVLLKRIKPTHLSCISVLEHAQAKQQKGIFDAVEHAFEGKQFVVTFEFHELHVFFEQMLHTKALSDAVSGLQRYYLNQMCASPLHCVNAFSGLDRLWYPMALQFSRVAHQGA